MVKPWKIFHNDNHQYHRLDGPAVIIYNKEGTIIQELWFKDGLQHRVDGPASINYISNTKSYYLNGIFYEPKPFWIKLLNDGIIDQSTFFKEMIML